MTPASWPRGRPLEERLLLIDPRADAYADLHIGDLPRALRAGDVLVLNDAATLPASLQARSPSGKQIELRLVAREEDGAWRALVLGEGDWRQRTEDRPLPEPLGGGDLLSFSHGLTARVEARSELSPRLITLRFDSDERSLWPALYRLGRPIQYSYLKGPLALWHVQNRYASRPWAMEIPSAGHALTWGLLLELARGGVRLCTLTHAAGISSTGDPALDARMPFPERFEIPRETVDAVAAARAAGGRVVAVGTSVVRALEGCAALHGGRLAPGQGVTELVVRQTTRLRVVDGLLTGIHEPTASHFELLQAFAPPDLLRRAYAHAEAEGYLGHEFGDANLILAA